MNASGDHNDLYELYVLGLLEEPERSRIEDDLRRNDPAAKARLRRALDTNAILGTLAPDVAPSKQLRRRVVSIAEPQQSRLPWNLAWIGLSACLVAGLVYTGIQRQGLQGELEGAQRALDQTRATLEIREATLEFLRRPETRLLKAGTAEERKPVAKVFVNRTQGVLLVAANLAALPAGRTYEMWVVPKVGGPRPAGLFKPLADGSAIHLQTGALSLDDAAAIALSVEPEGGSSAPTTTPFLITPVAE
ncbi:MAG: anti-sigma factor [Acidobacteria bacterium]|nr:anti-sigma factor [Acidobacteriota bacterium]